MGLVWAAWLRVIRCSAGLPWLRRGGGALSWRLVAAAVARLGLSVRTGSGRLVRLLHLFMARGSSTWGSAT